MFEDKILRKYKETPETIKGNDGGWHRRLKSNDGKETDALRRSLEGCGNLCIFFGNKKRRPKRPYFFGLSFSLVRGEYYDIERKTNTRACLK